MSSLIDIQKVNSRNFSLFIDLIIELAEYEHVEPPDKQAQQRLKRDCLGEKPWFEAFLAYDEQQPVGYVIIYYTYSSFLALPTLYIEDVYIKKDCRRKGFGQQLFDFCKQYANKKNCGRMEWNVYTWNAPAIEFYEKNSATRLDKFYYRLAGEEL